MAFSPDAEVPADLSRQSWAVMPRTHYRDALMTCRDCLRAFVFHALEQKHWYEDLGFNLSAQCVRCPDCRRSQHQLRKRFRRYSLLIGKDDLTVEELAKLVGDATHLHDVGILEDEQRLRRLKNLALARIPDEPVTLAIIAIIEQIPEIDGHRLGRAEARMLRGIIRLIDDGAGIVTEAEARAMIIAPEQIGLQYRRSYAEAFEQLLRRGLLTWELDRSGNWGVRPSPEAVESLR